MSEELKELLANDRKIIEENYKEIERLHSIIKEAIKYIKNNGCYCLCFNKYGCVDDLRPEECDELLEILEKENI